MMPPSFELPIEVKQRIIELVASDKEDTVTQLQIFNNISKSWRIPYLQRRLWKVFVEKFEALLIIENTLDTKNYFAKRLQQASEWKKFLEKAGALAEINCYAALYLFHIYTTGSAADLKEISPYIMINNYLQIGLREGKNDAKANYFLAKAISLEPETKLKAILLNLQAKIEARPVAPRSKRQKI